MSAQRYDRDDFSRRLATGARVADVATDMGMALCTAYQIRKELGITSRTEPGVALLRKHNVTVGPVFKTLLSCLDYEELRWLVGQIDRRHPDLSCVLVKLVKERACVD